MLNHSFSRREIAVPHEMNNNAAYSIYYRIGYDCALKGGSVPLLALSYSQSDVVNAIINGPVPLLTPLAAGCANICCGPDPLAHNVETFPARV